MNWIPLQQPAQLEEIALSNGYSIIFKHSTRCSISLMAKRKFEMDWEYLPGSAIVYFLDILQHRNISNELAERFKVHHESPQLLLIKDGECIYETSHGEISAEEAAEQIQAEA